MTPRLHALVVGSSALVGCGGAPTPALPEPPPPSPHEVVAMNASLSPAGEPHPGEIANVDRVDDRTWTSLASEVPQTLGWVQVGEVWEAVVRIEISGTPGQRRITKLGRDGKMLESTVQAPPPPRAPPSPTPVPTPD